MGGHSTENIFHIQVTFNLRYLATSLPPSLLTIGDHLLHKSLSFSSTLICLVHCVWPSYSSVLSTLWCCQTIVSSVCLFSFFLQPCLLQFVEWVGCHCLSLCDQSKPASLSFPAIPFWHQAHWECWHLFFSLSNWHLTFFSRSTFLLPWSCSHRIWRGSRLQRHKWVHSTLELRPALLWGLLIGFCHSKCPGALSFSA